MPLENIRHLEDTWKRLQRTHMKITVRIRWAIMQYKQRTIVIFPLLHEPKSAVHAWYAPVLRPDLPTVEVITDLLA